jgi:hypothetical protein
MDTSVYLSRSPHDKFHKNMDLPPICSNPPCTFLTKKKTQQIVKRLDSKKEKEKTNTMKRVTKKVKSTILYSKR